MNSTDPPPMDAAEALRLLPSHELTGNANATPARALRAVVALARERDEAHEELAAVAKALGTRVPPMRPLADVVRERVGRVEQNVRCEVMDYGEAAELLERGSLVSEKDAGRALEAVVRFQWLYEEEREDAENVRCSLGIPSERDPRDEIHAVCSLVGARFPPREPLSGVVREALATRDGARATLREALDSAIAEAKRADAAPFRAVVSLTFACPDPACRTRFLRFPHAAGDVFRCPTCSVPVRVVTMDGGYEAAPDAGPVENNGGAGSVERA